MLLEDGASAGAVGALFLLIAVLVWCIVGVVRAAIDLRQRTRVVRSTAAAAAGPAGGRRRDPRRDAPARRVFRRAAAAVGMIGVVEDADAAGAARRDPALRRRCGGAAAARTRRASPWCCARGGPRGPTRRAQLDATADHLRREIVAGVDGYGELVSAASDAVSASRALSAGSAGRFRCGGSLSGDRRPDLRCGRGPAVLGGSAPGAGRWDAGAHEGLTRPDVRVDPAAGPVRAWPRGRFAVRHGPTTGLSIPTVRFVIRL